MPADARMMQLASMLQQQNEDIAEGPRRFLAGTKGGRQGAGSSALGKMGSDLASMVMKNPGLFGLGGQRSLEEMGLGPYAIAASYNALPASYTKPGFTMAGGMTGIPTAGFGF